MSTGLNSKPDPAAYVELHFPVVGRRVWADHGYELAGAISRALGAHPPEGVAIAPLDGAFAVGGQVALGAASRLRLRLPADRIGAMLSLAGATLEVGGEAIVLGTPTVRALRPAGRLRSRLVTIKGFTEPGPFLEAARRQLGTLGVAGEAAIPEVRGGPHAGKPYRRVLRIKGKVVVGFPLVVDGLADRDSLVLQAMGIGGRRHMGCGIFVPAPGEGGAG